uniref:EF-hand domain-containing protein n=1 Tax=Polytomella parva TaxID=51329 RepID=A0A7S0YHU5_9CHLO
MFPSMKKKLAPGSKYSKAQVLELKDIFNFHDKDKDGKITLKEMGQSLAEYKSVKKQELNFFRVLDINRDGVVTFDEFLRRTFPWASTADFNAMLDWANEGEESKKKTGNSESNQETWEIDDETSQDLKKLFNVWDTNHNGILEYEELVVQAENCGFDSDEIRRLFNAHDKDHNGVISFEEFVFLVKTSFI